MANVTFQYRSTKESANLEARLSFTNAGKRISWYAPVNFIVSRSFWRDYKAGKNFRDVDKANTKTELTGHLIEIQDFILKKFNPAINDKPGWLKDTVHAFYHPKTVQVIPNGLLDYWSYYIDIKGNEIMPGSAYRQKWDQVRDKITRLQEYTNKKYLIRDVDEAFKKDFEDCLQGMEYSPATIRKQFAFIKTLCFHAEAKGIAVSRELRTLSVNIKETRRPKVYLSFSELELIKELKGLPNYLDSARDWLLISCYTGQRISDFMRFNRSMIRNTQEKMFIDIRQQKTGKDVTIPVLPELIEILNKRKGEFPHRISDQRYNDYIKEVCRMAGITKRMAGKLATVIKVNGKAVTRTIPGTYEKWQLVGSHIGRRSFATNHYGLLPTSFLKDITGHSGEAMLLRYIGKTSKDTAGEAYDIMLKINK